MRDPYPTPLPPLTPPLVDELDVPDPVLPDPLPLDPLPSVPDVLAATGPTDDVAAWVILACGLMLAGWLIWSIDQVKRGGS